MENLTALVDSLRPGEIQLIQHIYSFKNNPDNKKRDKLLRLIVEKEATDDDTALLILYGDKSYSAFSQLKARLKDDILNVLLLQDPSVKFTARYAQAAFDCRRAIIQGEILLARGVYQEAISVLTKAAKTARKYELYAELTLAEDMIRTHVTMKPGSKLFNEYSASINDAITDLERLQRVKHDHYLLTRPELCRSTGKSITVVGKEILRQLEEDMKASDSVRVRFYYHLAAVNYHKQFHNFDLALKHATTLHELIENDPVVNSKANLAGAKMEMTDIMLHVSRNADAVIYAQQSLDFFKPGMLNELMALHKMFIAYFRQNDIEKAGEILQLALKHKQLKFNDLLVVQWQLLKAAMEFRKGEHAQSAKTLKKENTTIRDKSGWLLGYHLMEIMNMLEITDNSDWIDNKIEALKKLVYRQSERVEEECPRFTLISRLLQSLVAHSYDFYTVVQNEKEVLDKLANGTGVYHWDHSSPEVIRFDQWFISKIKPVRKAG
jgi:tetratricopeptide (TPR) repeat protein